MHALARRRWLQLKDREFLLFRSVEEVGAGGRAAPEVRGRRQPMYEQSFFRSFGRGLADGPYASEGVLEVHRGYEFRARFQHRGQATKWCWFAAVNP